MFRILTAGRALAFAAALAGFSIPASAQAEKFQSRSYKAQSGLNLPYRIFIPPSYVKGTPIPLVLALHGSGERGSNNTAQVTANRLATTWADDTVQNRFRSIVVAPQCPLTDTWVAYYQPVDKVTIKPPLKAVMELIDSLEKEFTLDPDRFYIVGLSMGAFATWDLLARYPGRFAAAVPICGAGDTTKVDRMKMTPIWAFHGTLDDVVPVQGTRDMIANLKEVGTTPEPKYTEYPGVRHDSWTPAMKEPALPGWLFAQKKAGSMAVRREHGPAPAEKEVKVVRGRVRMPDAPEAIRLDGRPERRERGQGRIR